MLKEKDGDKMKIEKERKYIFADPTDPLNLIVKAKTRSLIFQWYLNEGERIRLEISSGKFLWTRNLKTEIDVQSRYEEEVSLNPSDIDFNRLFTHPMVVKNRYFLEYDPEIIIDEILNPAGMIKYNMPQTGEKLFLTEIEEKDTFVKDLSEFMNRFFANRTLIDVTGLKKYKNSEIAGLCMEHFLKLFYEVIRG